MLIKIRKTILMAVVCLFSVILTSCSLINQIFKQELDPSTFDEFTYGLLQSIVGNDELTANYYFENRETYGLTDYEPSLPTPSVTSVTSIAAINLYFGQIKNYDYEKLNDDQKMTYNIIVNLVDYINSKTSEMSYLDNNYLGTYLGYQAQLPLLLTEYHFRNQTDVENYFKFLSLIPDTFKTYYDFEVKKADQGYGMPDFVIDNVVEQCLTFVSGIDDKSSFMFNVIENKINNCSFLNDAQKVNYINRNNELLTTAVRSGYMEVANSLINLKGRGTNNQGLSYYVNAEGENIGKQYYEILFKNTVGYDITPNEAMDYINAKITEYLEQLKVVSTRIVSSQTAYKQLEAIENGEFKLMTNTPEQQLKLYNRLIKKDFPSLNVEPEIVVKYIDESMQNNFSPAAYMTSAIDNVSVETIYLNPADIYLKDEFGNLTNSLDTSYLFTTLAHEGLPGHLYQTAYFKSLDVNPIRKILKNSGYVEGWATYAENYAYEFLDGIVDQNIIDYFQIQSKLTAAIYSKVDLGIHYEGWTASDMDNFMSLYFTIDSEKVLSAYQQLVEIPTNYQEYFFTYLKICDMKDRVKTKLGSDFNVLDFHTTILNSGPAPLKYVEAIVNEKYEIK